MTVAKNLAEAARWYALAAEQGQASAQNSLGALATSPRSSVSIDLNT